MTASEPAPVAPDVATRLARNDDGTTAVEFALIGGPFIMLLIGIMSVCIYFFTILEVENAVWQGSRDLRVGNYQQALGDYNGLTGENLKNAFKNQICGRIRSVMDCDANMRILVQTYTGFGSIVQPSCTQSNGTLVANSSINAGGASAIVLITGCMRWEFGGKLPFFKIGDMPDGSFLIQTSYVFRTEPYN